MRQQDGASPFRKGGLAVSIFRRNRLTELALLGKIHCQSFSDTGRFLLSFDFDGIRD